MGQRDVMLDKARSIMVKLISRRTQSDDKEVEAKLTTARREHAEAIQSKNNVLREFHNFEAHLSASKR